MKVSEDRLISLRRAKVAEMLAKGYNQSEIAKACVTSEPTISRDVAFLRKEAIATMDKYLQDLPLQHAKARIAADMVLRIAFEIMEDRASDQRLNAAKLVLNATELRLGFLSDLTALDTSIKKAEAMKKEIERLRKPKPSTFEIVSGVEPASGKVGKRFTRIVKKSHKKEETFVPVV